MRKPLILMTIKSQTFNSDKNRKKKKKLNSYDINCPFANSMECMNNNGTNFHNSIEINC